MKTLVCNSQIEAGEPSVCELREHLIDFTPGRQVCGEQCVEGDVCKAAQMAAGCFCGRDRVHLAYKIIEKKKKSDIKKPCLPPKVLCGSRHSCNVLRIYEETGEIRTSIFRVQIPMLPLRPL